MKRLLLIGAGHAHAQVLLDLLQSPLAGVEVTLVSPHARAPYSGMIPGWLAGQYRFDEAAIDFQTLCVAAGARWIEAELDALDPHQQLVRLTSGVTLAYDIVSMNVGSTLRPPDIDGPAVLAMRPLSELADAYQAVLERLQTDSSTQDFHVTAVGGGAAGFESLLAVLHRLRALKPGRMFHGRLLTRGAMLLPGLSGMARRAATRALDKAGVVLELGAEWTASRAADSDLVLWATGAQAHEWQTDPARRGALAVSRQGFIQIDEQLRSVSHAQVFAVGDCAEWRQPLPKAGVYAVRMGPVLSHNLRAALGLGDQQPFRPQHQFLALLSTGDGSAIASRGVLGARGRWIWRWKDRIDRGFVRRFAITPSPSNANMKTTGASQ